MDQYFFGSQKVGTSGPQSLTGQAISKCYKKLNKILLVWEVWEVLNLLSQVKRSLASFRKRWFQASIPECQVVKQHESKI